MSAHYYRSLLTQRVRMEAFRSAIQAAVRPGARVLEVGAGLATYSMFAARAGAARVWAVEGGAIAPITRQVIRDNGLGDVVELLEGWYPDVAPPEPVDVVIYEDYGSRLLDRWSWSVLDHVARAGLRPGGVLLPGRARIWMALVHAPDKLAPVAPFADRDDVLYGLDWEASRESAANTPLTMLISPGELLGEPALIAELALLPAPDPGSVRGSGEWAFEFGVEIHGLAFWFDLEVGAGTWLTNAPRGQPTSWGHLYLPTPEAIRAEPGTQIRAEVGFDRGPLGEPSWMRWDLAVGARRWSAHEFRSSLATGAQLERQSTSWRPQLGEAGRAARRVLDMSDGTRSLHSIVLTLVEEGFAATPDQAERLVRRTLAGRTL